MMILIINPLAIMKKFYFAICAIAAALLLAGCQKENINVVETAEVTHTVVFTAEKMVETKTAIASEEGWFRTNGLRVLGTEWTSPRTTRTENRR
jgi:hypothetical protein